ncbi:uncharacterized protein LOC124815080 isoform X1 [Hydra vulgaris]|uniref:uncharacterized protein LOC124815080 isoform X1 n=1 Tax=Hydra vulgaris TaxID=6087 RepID=UPI0032E9CD21
MCYQVVNTLNPNSTENTIVFNIFESKDLRVNIKVGMTRFQKQIEDLQTMKYRGNNIRVFIFGDYEFLCALYGISGASGKHCCLFCHATANEMKVFKNERPVIELRTIESLQNDFERFKKNGGAKENAKYYNNVITEPILKIPLDQVSLPSLHIALGVYLKIFNMFEEAAHEVDIMMAASIKNKDSFLYDSYQDFILKQQHISDLEICIANLDDQIELVKDAVAAAILNNPENVENVQSVYIPQLGSLNRAHMEKIQELKALEKSSAFQKSEGPCTQQIEVILQKLNVQRQAYHGKSFIGNHVHKMLKEESILELCNSVPILVHKKGFSGTTLHEKSIEVCNKYKQLFYKFSNCYHIFSSKNISTSELTQLGMFTILILSKNKYTAQP